MGSHRLRDRWGRFVSTKKTTKRPDRRGSPKRKRPLGRRTTSPVRRIETSGAAHHIWWTDASGRWRHRVSADPGKFLFRERVGSPTKVLYRF